MPASQPCTHSCGGNLIEVAAACCFPDMAKVFHVVDVILHVEEREQGDGDVARDEACILMEDAFRAHIERGGRRIDVKVALREFKVIDLELPKETNDA